MLMKETSISIRWLGSIAISEDSSTPIPPQTDSSTSLSLGSRGHVEVNMDAQHLSPSPYHRGLATKHNSHMLEAVHLMSLVCCTTQVLFTNLNPEADASPRLQK